MPARLGSTHRVASLVALALAALLVAECAFAVRANPKGMVRLQPDGTEITIRMLGDERIVFYEDEDGFTVLRDDDGWWVYADPSSHRRERLAPTRLRVGIDRLPEGARKHARPLVDPSQFRIPWEQQDDGSIGELFRARARARSAAGEPTVRALGVTQPASVPLLVIPIEFSDWAHTSGPDTPYNGEPDYNPNATMPGNTAAAWQDLFGNRNVPGGLNHYYWDVSYGQFQWNVAVASCNPDNTHVNATCNGGWYKNQNTMKYWGEDTSRGPTCNNDARNSIKDLVEWAIKAAEPEVDYAAYDKDGNGQISDAELMILVVHARDGQENYGDGCGTNPADPGNDHIWSHKWNIDTAVTVDGKTIPSGKTYSINPEFEPGLRWNASRNYYDVIDKWFGVGVYAHESFHTLGAPDLYDYGYDANVAGEWDLMDGGSYNGAKSGTHPPHMGTPLKQDIRLNADTPANSYGWIFDDQIVRVEPADISPSDGIRAIDPISGAGTTNIMHRLIMPNDPTEWIVLENRANQGYYEPYLPEHGILIWHRDMNGGRDAWPYAANVMRKGWANTSTGLNTSTAGAAFSLEDGQTAFTATTDPNNNRNEGTASGLKDIRCIGAEGSRMQYVYGTISGPNPGYAGASVSGGTDGDPFIDNGETATLTVSVSNSSCAGAAATGVELALAVAPGTDIDPSAVTIVPITTLPTTIAAGATATATFSVSLACNPAGYAGKSISFAFTISANTVADVSGTFTKQTDKDYAFFDDAEGGVTGWTTPAPFNPSSGCASAANHGTWAWQNPTDRRRSGNRAYHTPETTATSNLCYANPNETWVSPNIPLSAAPRELRFWSAAKIPQPGYTRARVWVSTNNGGTWTRLNWYKDDGDLSWEEVSYSLSGFADATQIKLAFAMYTYGCWPNTTATEGWYLDDIAILIDEQTSCGACTPPGAPAITSITDADACAQSGIRVNYTPGAGATSHNLLRDGAVVVSGYASGALYNPGDGASHSYRVQAVVQTCTTDSPAQSFADGDASPSAPAAPTVTDTDACRQTGVSVAWNPVAGATAYDLLIDTTTIAGVWSPYAHDPGDTALHAYRVRVRNVSCTGAFSPTSSAADGAAAPTAPSITSITDDDTCLQSGIRISYQAGAGATRHDLLRDGLLAVSGYVSGALYNPADTGSYAYTIQAVYGACTTDSATEPFADGVTCLCTSAPTFAGLASVETLTGTTCGLRLSWSAGTSNCPSGPTLVYDVYRSTSAGFTPAPSDLLAACVAGTSYDDVTALADTTYHYVVRAEDSTAFGAGPCNHGNTDANTVRRSGAVISVSQTASQTDAVTASLGSATAPLTPSPSLMTASAGLSYALSYVTAGSSTATPIQPSSEDSYVDAANATSNYGTATTMLVSSAKSGVSQRSLVKFSLAAIPAGVTITNATLELYGTGSVSRTYNVHRITSAWSQTNVTWNTQPTFTATADAQTVTGTAAGWKTWNVTSVVQSWYAGTTTNHGLLIRDNVENTNKGPTWSFVTLEGTTANRPTLRVTYQTGTGSMTANTQVELIGPTGPPCLVKAYGANDPPKPWDATACYNAAGPGAWQVRVSEDTGGAATLANASLSLTGLTCAYSPSEKARVFTVRSASASNKLEWTNGHTGAAAIVIRARTDGVAPTSPADGEEVVCTYPPGYPVADAYAYNTCEHAGLVNGSGLTYSLFLRNADGVYSTRASASGRPFDTATSPVVWAYSTGATAMTPPGIRPGAVGTGAVYTVANDRMLHASNPTPSGGDWPRTAPFAWRPVMMNGPSQDRPTILYTGLGMNDVGMLALVASQDGFVYAMEARRGNADGSLALAEPIWVSDGPIGDGVQGSPTACLAQYGASWNLVFAGARNATSDNRVVALNPVVSPPYPNNATVAWTFDNGGGTAGIGMISSSIMPVYGVGRHRLYFTSRERTEGSPDTVWALAFTDTSATKLWSRAVGSADAAPAVYADRVYVGTNEGRILALDADTGTPLWNVGGNPFFATSDGPVKGSITVVRTALPRKLYFSTTNTVWCLIDTGTTVVEAWRITAIPFPSAPVRAAKTGVERLYLGSSDGSLYEINALTDPPTVKSQVVGTGAAAIGAPAIDAVTELAHVGSEAGIFYAVRTPLP